MIKFSIISLETNYTVYYCYSVVLSVAQYFIDCTGHRSINYFIPTGLCNFDTYN